MDEKEKLFVTIRLTSEEMRKMREHVAQKTVSENRFVSMQGIIVGNLRETILK